MIWIAVDAMGGDEATKHVDRDVALGAPAGRPRAELARHGDAARPHVRVVGATIVGHGRSSAEAARNAVAVAFRFASDRFIEHVAREVAAPAVGLHQ